MNRLKNEKSPYLLQHADNPVDWYPWGDEAFQTAKRNDKPIFLSIGYSTCHWCHVMEKESFEDIEAAKYLNDGFICIKVDREERPDIDAVYMTACQALTGSGGWPLTIIMTPDGKPFFAGTYLPKTDKYGRMGLIPLLTAVSEKWKTDRKRLLLASEEITHHLRSLGKASKDNVQADITLLDKAANYYKNSYDTEYSGFGGAPKFPSAHNIIFLLKYASLSGKKDLLGIAENTLTQMYRGGIFDHVGGGFSRYSTDRMWLVPHFEKMLYDNALLVYAYTEAYRLTGKPLYKKVVSRTLDYVSNELTHPDGGFYSGQDADIHGEEGKYYTFTIDEIKEVLGSEAKYFCDWYGATPRGNFEGKNIFNLLYNENFESEDEKLAELRKKVYDYRMERYKLHKDDKILTSWNALMIAALSNACTVFNEPKYLLAAEKAYEFIENNLNFPEALYVRWRDGEKANVGHLDDYAFYAFALLELYSATFEVKYLKTALNICERMVSQFFDHENGGFYLDANDADRLILRLKESYDGAMPSGNSVAALVLNRMSRLTAEKNLMETSEKQKSFIAARANSLPAGHSFFMYALTEILYPAKELVCALNDSSLIKEIAALPAGQNLSVIVITKENREELIKLLPYLAGYELTDEPRFFLCAGSNCLAPVNSVEKLKELIKSE